jgi:hypothetical protein
LPKSKFHYLSILELYDGALNYRLELCMRAAIAALVILFILSSNSRSEELINENPIIHHPEWYTKILDWSFYVAWGGVAMINSVFIENTSNIGYDNIKIGVRYYSTSGSSYGVLIGQETGFLSAILKPNSKKYLKNGTVLGLGSTNSRAGSVEVLGAVPLIQQSRMSR